MSGGVTEPSASAAQAAALAEVKVIADGPILLVRLNRPEQHNALTPAMHGALQDAFDRLAREQSLRVGILMASGPSFCAGSDLKSAHDRQSRGEGLLAMPAGGYGGLASRFDLGKPLIAAVNGPAIGGGLELALACDLIVAADSARFATPEPYWGKVAIGGAPHRLARSIGIKRAMDLVLTGRMVGADEALALGFVNRVVPREELDETCRRLALDLLRAGPEALAAAKQLVDRTLDQPSLAAAISDQEAMPAMIAWRTGSEGAEGARAFAEKRPPRWQPQ